jgi:hypothetical protein
MWLAGLGLVLVGCFGLVLLRGAPYLPTLKPQVEVALDLVDLEPGQTLLELGSGDGRVLRAAAQRGLNVVGYELNPLLVIWSRLLCWRYRKHVRIVWGDFWRAEWPPAEGIFVFLLPRYMKKLDKKVMQYSGRPIKLVSFAFEIEDYKPEIIKHGVRLYLYK